jgi:hypothetical protein
VIGNPPYYNISSIQNHIGLDSFITYNKNADIYCLFYEMAFKILTNRGLLCFITSNKWMSANYGKSLRSYLLRVSNSLLLLDFPNLQIFENAVVFVNIYIGEKSKNTNSLNAAKIEDHFMQIRDFAQYIKSRIIRIDVMEDRPWKIIDNSVEILNRKIENVGTKLKEWDLQFYRGVTTGHNKAINQTFTSRERY